VTSLELSDNNLAAATPSLAAGLAQLPSLRLLSLNNCSLTTWPLVGLSPGSLQALHTLELAGNSFGRSCPLDGLAVCPRLKTLDLSGVGNTGGMREALLRAFYRWRLVLSG
jgi:Leucine-rich repeat (LRR) protein